ncbi:PKD domain-containing protein, partial [Marinobacter sp.]|uniref:PKD domain-containing protein n=1 Tax=Marinobacter sp. TaxID=50741 RepID=UPI0025C31DD3
MFQTQGFWSEKSREGAARMAWPVGLLAIVAAVGGCGNEKDAASGTGTETGTGTRTETENSAPVAVSGAPQTVDEGTLVFLDGSGSSDPEGDELTYLWSQKEGRKAELSD